MNSKQGSAAAAAKSLQLCPTLCDPIDGSPPGSPLPGILQARTLKWVAISFSNAWEWKGKVKSLSRVRLLVTPWTAVYQAPPSMGFSRQEYWCQEPARESPPTTRSCGRALMGKASQSSRAPPRICLSVYPKTRICLFYYFMTFTNSPDINGGLSPTTFLWRKLT